MFFPFSGLFCKPVSYTHLFHLQEPSGFKQKLKSSHPRLWGAVRQAKSVLQGQNRPARETIRLSDAFEHQYDSEFFPLLSSQRDFNFAPALDLLVIGSDEVFNCAQYADAGKQIPWELYGDCLLYTSTGSCSS